MAEIAENWITTADRLREIRKARDGFLLRWAIDVLEADPATLDALSDAISADAMDVARDVVEQLPVPNRKSRLFGSGVLDD